MTDLLRAEIANLAYLIAALLFIGGLKCMAHPRTAVRGNLLGAIGMGLAILTAIADPHVQGYLYLVVGLIVGSLVDNQDQNGPPPALHEA
jgi:NAD(P) transhydrogenase subunit beta